MTQAAVRPELDIHRPALQMAYRVVAVFTDGTLATGLYTSPDAADARVERYRLGGAVANVVAFTKNAVPLGNGWKIKIVREGADYLFEATADAEVLALYNRVRRPGDVVVFSNNAHEHDVFTITIPNAPYRLIRNDVQRLAGREAYARGMELLENNSLTNFARTGPNRYRADVFDGYAYAISVETQPDNTFTFACQCPLGLAGRICRHTTALTLKVIEFILDEQAVVPDHNHTEGYGLVATLERRCIAYEYVPNLDDVRERMAVLRRANANATLTVRDYGAEDDVQRVNDAVGGAPIPGTFFLANADVRLIVGANEPVVIPFATEIMATRAQEALAQSLEPLDLRTEVTLQVTGAPPAPDLSLEGMVETAGLPEPMYYCSESGEIYKFRFACMTNMTGVAGGAKSWIPFILEQPPLEGRNADMYHTHRVDTPRAQARYGEKYCCWSQVLHSEREARGMVVLWTRAIERYIRDGTRF